MPRDDAARLEQVVTTLTILQLRTDLLRRRLARRDDLSATDRAWLATSLGEITQAVRALAALMGARGGLLEPARHDGVANGRFGASVTLIRRVETLRDMTPDVPVKGAEQPESARRR